MKKRILITLAIVTALSTSILSGCGDSTTSKNADNTEAIVESATEEPEEASSDIEPESIEESEPEEIENEQEQILVQTESVTTDTDGNVVDLYVYEYNEKGEKIRYEYTSTRNITGTPITRTGIVEYEYDETGNQIKELVYYDGENTATSITEATYDDEGKQIKETVYEYDSILSYSESTYDSDKDLIKQTYYTKDDELNSTVEYVYDSDKNLIEETVYNYSGDESSKTTYEYNDMGDKSKELKHWYEYADLIGYSETLEEYEYDDKHRLIKSTRYEDNQLDSTTITEYDDNDNILKETKYDENESLESTTEYKYMLLQDYLDSEKNNITEQKTVMEDNQSKDTETTEPEVTEADTVDTSGRKPITPEELIFLYDGNTNLEKIYYRTSENASWTLFFDGIAEPGSLISNSSGMITLYEGYFGVKLVFDNGSTEHIHTINLVEGQVRNYDGSIGTTEYTGEMLEFLITDTSENFLDVDWS